MEWMLFLDDERLPPEMLIYDYEIARSFEDAISLIEKHGCMPIYISFDHDLGQNSKTGYDFAKILVDYDLDAKYEFPGGFAYCVHSQNPIGKKNIESILDNYLEHKFGRVEDLQ